MDQKRAVIFLTTSQDPEQKKPLMLNDILFCPILTWVARKLKDDGVERFFAVCGPEYADEARACFPVDADVTVSDQHPRLLDFVSGVGRVIVIPRPVVPAEQAGEGYVYSAEGFALAEGWKKAATIFLQDVDGERGWIALNSGTDIQNVELHLRDEIVRRHIANGVRVLDPGAVYIDPRVKIGRGTMVLPGTILRGGTDIGRDCVIGPNAMKELYVVNCCRTAIGSFGGSLKNVSATEMGSIVVKEALNRAGVKPEQVDEVMFGCILTAGLGQNVARQVAVKAGIPYAVPAYTVGMASRNYRSCVTVQRRACYCGAIRKLLPRWRKTVFFQGPNRGRAGFSGVMIC